MLKFILFVGRDCKKFTKIFGRETRIQTVNILFFVLYLSVLLVKCICLYMNEVIFSRC